MTYNFVTVDVFTKQRFSGNQLAVLTDAQGLTTEQMQRIAREFNYAESTFVLPAKDPANDAEVRIFTPGKEVPFAGHPNIGTAFVLGLQRGADAAGNSNVLRFEEGAGIVPVQIQYEDGTPVYCELTAPESLSIDNGLSAEPELQALATALSIDRNNIVTSSHRPCRASVGLPFLIAEVKDLETLAQSYLNAQLWQPIADGCGANAVHIYTRKTDKSTLDVQARMFAPKFGVPEDPATGSANCALAGLLASIDERENAEFHYRIAQGVEMGRPSELKASASKQAGVVNSVRIGGACVKVAEGIIEAT